MRRVLGIVSITNERVKVDMGNLYKLSEPLKASDSPEMIHCRLVGRVTRFIIRVTRFIIRDEILSEEEIKDIVYPAGEDTKYGDIVASAITEFLKAMIDKTPDPVNAFVWDKMKEL